MSLLDWLFGRTPLPPTPSATCPHCGSEMATFWADDDVATVIGIGGDRALPAGEHLVLRADCDCGWRGRANTARVLNPRLLASR